MLKAMVFLGLLMLGLFCFSCGGDDGNECKFCDSDADCDPGQSCDIFGQFPQQWQLCALPSTNECDLMQASQVQTDLFGGDVVLRSSVDETIEGLDMSSAPITTESSPWCLPTPKHGKTHRTDRSPSSGWPVSCPGPTPRRNFGTTC